VQTALAGISAEFSSDFVQANPKLATTKDDDDRLPIHWAVAYNHLPIVELLVSTKDFDPDVEVRTPLERIFRTAKPYQTNRKARTDHAGLL
jgi:ankyrin repeat protein